MAVLPNHSHCKFCGNPTPYGDDYCDDDCRELHRAEESVGKRKDLMFYGMIAVSLVAILAVGAIVGMLR
ncbi:MAG: DUF2116 family Zn-ribbon domain-containing protein [Candidatus Methanomethylophilaceae archaeon]|nr:DUF2116 family Zn-ribbon domain-containing protein [Candidatus Methanomethylophilaceae archaeon]